VGDEPRVLEEAKREALAAFAAIAAVIDLSGEAASPEQTLAANSLRESAVRHLSAALDIMRRAKGVDA
jgi:hypothetical protein